jgi:hypothetical protein
MFMGLDGTTWALAAVGLVIAAVIFVRRLREGVPPRYAPATPRQKAICAVLLVGMLAAWAIFLVGWRVFGGYEKQVAIVVQLISLLYFVRLTAILERA